MTTREQFKAAFGAVRAEQMLPNRTSDLVTPSHWRGLEHRRRTLAFLALWDLPESIIDAARVAHADQSDHSPVHPMRSASQLRWHTRRERAKREAMYQEQARRREADMRAWGLA